MKKKTVITTEKREMWIIRNDPKQSIEHREDMTEASSDAIELLPPTQPETDAPSLDPQEKGTD